MVLELGAGTGAVSLCLLAARAVEGAVVTDIPDMLPHLNRCALGVAVSCLVVWGLWYTNMAVAQPTQLSLSHLNPIDSGPTTRNLAHNARSINPAQALVAPLRWGDAGDGALAAFCFGAGFGVGWGWQGGLPHGSDQIADLTRIVAHSRTRQPPQPPP